MSEKLNVYTTEAGVVLRLKPVREPLIRARLKKLEAEYRAEHPELDVPTYKAKTIAGEVQELELDGEHLEDPTDPVQTRVNQARWRKHEAALAEWAEIATEQEYLSWLMLGIDCEPPEGWETEIEAVGVNLPNDPLQRRALWLHYIALSPTDRALLRNELGLISVGSAVSPDQVDSFRRGARSALAREARTRFDDALAELAKGALVGEPEVPGAGNSEGVAEDTERVGQPES